MDFLRPGRAFFVPGRLLIRTKTFQAHRWETYPIPNYKKEKNNNQLVELNQDLDPEPNMDLDAKPNMDIDAKPSMELIPELRHEMREELKAKIKETMNRKIPKIIFWFFLAGIVAGCAAEVLLQNPYVAEAAKDPLKWMKNIF